MEKPQFEQTRLVLIDAAKKLSIKLNKTICASKPNEFLQSHNHIKVKEVAAHIYLTNQYMIKKVEKVIGLLNEGLLNQDSEYLESDLTIVETILNVSVFKIQSLPEFQMSLNYSMEELELKMASQIVKFTRLIKEIPSAYANNYMDYMKVIAGIKLDAYQLVYFAIKHTDHHLTQINRTVSIHEMIQSKERVFKVNSFYTYT